MDEQLSLEGQWQGPAYSEGAQGLAIIDIDAEFDCYRGTARLFIEGEPGATSEFQTRDKQHQTVEFFGLHLSWIPEDRAMCFSGPAIRLEQPDVLFPDKVDLSFALEGNNLIAKWKTDLGREGRAELEKSAAARPSEIRVEEISNWEAFKAFSLEQKPWKPIYRGQAESFRLRTKFHRSHRKDLVKYVSIDIPLAYRTLTARTNHLFDLTSAEQNGAFLNLLQHHGYPTPLLDWTYSPFVAAFFAYRKKQSSQAPSDKIRILHFDREAWMRDFAQLQVINFAHPHFSVLEALAIENPRALPQQSLSTLTNIDDIESYVSRCEKKTGQKYLSAIDLPASQRREVMIELSLMGITAGSLFPGIDGACEELSGRMFHP